MREIIGDLHSWRDRGSRVALARVIDLEGSAPRLPGATMAVTEDGEVAGSVSGGCVEGAVVTESLEVLANGEGRMVTFGYSDDEAFAVGLTCGGTIHLFLEAVNDTTWVLLDMLEELWDHDLPCSLVEKITNKNNLLEFKWHGLKDLKYYKPEKKENLSVSYSFLAGKVDIAEIFVQNKLILRADFNSTSYGTGSTAFIGLSEIWFED